LRLPGSEARSGRGVVPDIGLPERDVASPEKLGGLSWEVQAVSGARVGSAMNWRSVGPPQLKSAMVAWLLNGNETKCVFGPAK
jgi:hypothetical protein